MAGESSVPKILWPSTGPVAPQEQEILAGVLADMDAAFGGNLNTSNLETPQGQLASSETAAIGAKNDEILFIANQFDPEKASGIWQDGLGKIYFLDRIPASSTVVDVQCLGSSGVVIPAGSIVSDTSGNRYASVADGTIPAGGTATIQFQAVDTGPIDCPIGAITTIYRAIPGWDSVSNSVAGEPGRAVESRVDFEARRRASVALNAINSVDSIRAAVLAVKGVVDARVVDNPLGTAATVGGVDLLPHSLFVSASGGNSAKIAKAIWGKKPPGCDYNGSTSITVTDDAYADPKPAYTVKFTRPAHVRTYFAISIASLPSNPSNIADLIASAVLSAFNGQDGGSRAGIGSTIYASRFYAPILAVSSSPIEILSLFVGKTASPTNTALAINNDEIPTLSSGDISVSIV